MSAESPYLLYMTFFLVASNIMIGLYNTSACPDWNVNDIRFQNYTFNTSEEYNKYVQDLGNKDCTKTAVPTWFWLLFNGSVISVLALTIWHYGKPVG